MSEKSNRELVTEIAETKSSLHLEYAKHTALYVIAFVLIVALYLSVN